MKILHTADLHLGQVIYQNYERSDEHQHFFKQLTTWCLEHQPDALVVSGDVFDIQQPSATTKRAFTDYFVALHKACPTMQIVITAGNHDSASRIQADSSVWALASTTMIGLPPSVEPSDGWEEQYIVRLEQGYIIALPYMTGERQALIQHLLDVVANENTEGKPVVMLGHTAVTGLDLTGHDFEIGKLRTQDASSFGTGYDYLALGHIHKPQTIGHQEDALNLNEVQYAAPVIRYSGSALHVSCDEAYPHSVSLVEIDKHGGMVRIKQLRIDELRHFYVLPKDGSALTSEDEALAEVKQFYQDHERGYFRLRVDMNTDLSPNFNQMVYDIIKLKEDEIRYNPKIVWIGELQQDAVTSERPTFEVAELQQMTDPVAFIEKTLDQYPGLDIEMVREAFTEVQKEMDLMAESNRIAESKKNKKKGSAINTTVTTDNETTQE